MEKLLAKEIIWPIIIIIVSIILYFIIKQIIVKAFKASKKYGVHKKSITIMNLVNHVVKYIIIIITILTLLNIWGVDTVALITSLGIAGVIAGLALQDILKDFLAGFSIIVDNEFDVGDNIQIDNFRGDVIELGLKNTKIRAYSGEVLTISNRNIDKVINYSTQTSRCIIDIPVDYNSKLEKVEKVLEEVCQNLTENTNYLTSEMTILGIEKLDDSAVIYRLIADCTPTLDRQFKREVHRAVKLAFDKHKITIPFNQVVIHNE